MFGKIISFFAIIAACAAGIIPAAYVAPYATSYDAHHVNHAIAAPVAAAYTALPAAPLAYAASPFGYAASPYVSPYAAAPLIL